MGHGLADLHSCIRVCIYNHKEKRQGHGRSPRPAEFPPLHREGWDLFTPLLWEPYKRLPRLDMREPFKRLPHLKSEGGCTPRILAELVLTGALHAFSPL